jgi:hypothetical protein
MAKWPDGTPKSQNNAFDWRSRTATAMPPKAKPASARSKDLNASDSIFTTYTRAVKSVGNYPPVAVSRGERSTIATPTET